MGVRALFLAVNGEMVRKLVFLRPSQTSGGLYQGEREAMLYYVFTSYFNWETLTFVVLN